MITVLKNHNRLRNLAALLRRLRGTGTQRLQNVPVLIIDDEADQASLNTQVDQETQSTTYVRLMEVREALPHHTYLQYTATPQAPLLINIIDSLSPNFVHVLEPGDAYAGGEQFFAGADSTVRAIPEYDLPSKDNPLDAPPESLLKALRVFMVGVATGLFESGGTGNRSMLVHPSRLVAPHKTFHQWVFTVTENWKSILRLSIEDPDRLDLIGEFREAYDDLALTTALPEFDDVMGHLLLALRRTTVLEINASSGKTPEVQWNNNYGWILVGGQAMDRGFTVEGLTVTYMSRDVGIGNADTIQQRARFFGYKMPYFGYCRVYLEQGMIDALQSYVEHETYMRAQLKQLQESQVPLNEWKRTFVLDSRLGPCRKQVLEFEYARGEFADHWVSPSFVRQSGRIVDHNRQIVSRFVSHLDSVEDDGHADRTATRRHQVCRNMSLRDVLEQLLLPLLSTGMHDSSNNTGMLLQLSRALEDNPGEPCSVYRMSGGNPRERDVSPRGHLGQLFQGAAPGRRGPPPGAMLRASRQRKGRPMSNEGVRIQVEYCAT